MRALHSYYRNATPHSWFEGMKFSHFRSLLLSVTAKLLWSESGQISVTKIKYFRLYRNEYNKQFVFFFFKQINLNAIYRELSENLPKWLLVA